MKFYNNKIGWAYSPITGIHTLTGGDTVFYTGIKQTGSRTPYEYKLYQNYPNPFNPKTNIKYQIVKRSRVKLVVFDIIGKEVITLVNREQTAGTYEVDFMGKFTATGVYFYRMTVTDEKSGIVYTDTKKMVLLK